MTTQTLSLRPARTSSGAGSRIRTVVSWVLQVALAGQFVMAGVPKLAGDPIMVAMFDALGAGQWLRYVVGTLELAGAVGLLVAPVAGLAAIGLTALMIGAAVASVTSLGAGPVVPLTVAAVAALVVLLRRHRILDCVAVIRRYSDRARNGSETSAAGAGATRKTR
ncbi:MAG TPA: DoxX family protein [Microlunatus sp.]|nr:DoxX family protein [Microlunatus sp.]